jgi:hypothetical protein
MTGRAWRCSVHYAGHCGGNVVYAGHTTNPGRCCCGAVVAPVTGDPPTHVPGEEQAATVTDNPSSLLGIPGDDQLTIEDTP